MSDRPCATRSRRRSRRDGPTCGPSCSLILDGFGSARRRARQRDQQRAHAALGRAPGDVAAHDDRRLRACASDCPRARWATPKSATSTSAPAASSTRTSRASTTRSRPASSRRNPVLNDAIARRARTRRARCTCWACSRPAACTATSGRSPRWSSSPRAAGVRAIRRARLPRRPRHAAAGAPAASLAFMDDVCAAPSGRAHRLDRRPLLRDGPRPALGPRRAGLRPARRRPRAVHGADRRGRPRGRLRARRERRVRASRRRSSTPTARPRRWATATSSSS